LDALKGLEEVMKEEKTSRNATLSSVEEISESLIGFS
jgi:hypothetical protein